MRNRIHPAIAAPIAVLALVFLMNIPFAIAAATRAIWEFLSSFYF